MAADHVLINRAIWEADAPTWVERGRRAWGGERSSPRSSATSGRWPSVEAWKARKR